MSTHHAEVRWTAGADEDFLAGRYSRRHRLRFGGLTVEGSASPSIVPAPWSTPDAVDPEAAFVASLSACHMLWFLDLARRAGVEVRGYVDAASGELGRNAEGRQAMTRVTLRPRVDCDADPTTLADLHRRAHDACFIANSVRTEVVVDAPGQFAGPGSTLR
jgi:organic hydroperoxide reductase OsmC/OhrA